MEIRYCERCKKRIELAIGGELCPECAEAEGVKVPPASPPVPPPTRTAPTRRDRPPPRRRGRPPIAVFAGGFALASALAAILVIGVRSPDVPPAPTAHARDVPTSTESASASAPAPADASVASQPGPAASTPSPTAPAAPAASPVTGEGDDEDVDAEYLQALRAAARKREADEADQAAVATALQKPPDGASWRTLFDGTPVPGWRNAVVKDGALWSATDRDVYFMPGWSEYELALEYHGPLNGGVGVIGLSMRNYGRGDARLKVAVHGDGDIHVVSGDHATVFARGGAGSVKPSQWVPLRIVVTDRRFALKWPGGEMPSIDVSGCPAARGGIGLFMGAGLRNVRVRVIRP